MAEMDTGEGLRFKAKKQENVQTKIQNCVDGGGRGQVGNEVENVVWAGESE